MTKRRYIDLARREHPNLAKQTTRPARPQPSDLEEEGFRETLAPPMTMPLPMEVDEPVVTTERVTTTRPKAGRSTGLLEIIVSWVAGLISLLLALRFVFSLLARFGCSRLARFCLQRHGRFHP
jgi:hypothetical protein